MLTQRLKPEFFQRNTLVQIEISTEIYMKQLNHVFFAEKWVATSRKLKTRRFAAFPKCEDHKTICSGSKFLEVEMFF